MGMTAHRYGCVLPGRGKREGGWGCLFLNLLILSKSKYQLVSHYCGLMSLLIFNLNFVLSSVSPCGNPYS